MLTPFPRNLKEGGSEEGMGFRAPGKEYATLPMAGLAPGYASISGVWQLLVRPGRP